MIWIVGNRGLLGSALARCLRQARLEFLVSDAEVDITDRNALYSFAEQQLTNGRLIHWIVNCAAYTAVDKAEDEPRTAGRLNALGPKNLAAVAVRLGAVLIHISTDYIFDGQRAQGYTEADLPNPRSVYGRTKWAGEVAVARGCRRHYIVRTAWMFGRNGKSFVSAMLHRFACQAAVNVVNDQWGSPTYAEDLAEALFRLISAAYPPPYGIYHFTNRGVTSWYEFACEIYTQAASLGVCPEGSSVQPVTSAQYPMKAERPRYSILHTGKITEALQIDIPHFTDALNRYLRTVKKEKVKLL